MGLTRSEFAHRLMEAGHRVESMDAVDRSSVATVPILEAIGNIQAALKCGLESQQEAASFDALYMLTQLHTALSRAATERN